MMLKTNVILTEVFFRMRLIYPDMDDNKFADCAFASNAHLLVTNDRDFNVLKKVAFPQLTIVKIDEFIKILQNL